jgi:hypothetical protein
MHACMHGPTDRTSDEQCTLRGTYLATHRAWSMRHARTSPSRRRSAARGTAVGP